MYAVLFDIDGTLVQTGGAGQLAFAETFAAEFGVPELSGAVAFAGRSDRAIALDLMDVHGVAKSEANWRRFRTSYVSRLPDALRRRRGRVLPGVTDLLDRLKEMEGPLIGLLTGNVREGATRKLGHYGLNDRFGYGGFGDDVGDRCEIAHAAVAAARQFAAARNGHGSPTLSGVMVIGDTVHDIRCGRAVGAFVVAVPTGGSTTDELAAASPDLLLPDLSDSMAILDVVSAAMRN